MGRIYFLCKITLFYAQKGCLKQPILSLTYIEEDLNGYLKILFFLWISLEMFGEDLKSFSVEI